MKVYQTSEVLHEPTAVALGFFDGLHKGHQAVIGTVVDYARQHHVTPLVFTFFESPKTVLKGTQPEMLFTEAERLEQLEKMGISALYLEHFQSLRSMTAADFVCEFLRKKLKAEFVSCGFNYRFGAGGQGTAESLSVLCASCGMEMQRCEPIMYGGQPVSSTRIRQALSIGDIETVNALLGYKYGFAEHVIHGNEIGRTLGTPTLNQVFPEKMFVPALGVYASVVTLQGKKYCGVTNIGWKPTVGSDRLLAETWLTNYHGASFYGETVDIRLVSFIRPERKFDGLDALKQEIYRNGATAQKLVAPLLS